MIRIGNKSITQIQYQEFDLLELLNQFMFPSINSYKIIFTSSIKNL